MWPRPPSRWTVFRTPLVPPLWPLLWKTAVDSNSLFTDVITRNSLYSSTHPLKRFCSLGGVESPARQPCLECLVAFCQSWESMCYFCSYFFEVIFLYNTCSTSHFAVGCFSMSNPGVIRWVDRQTLIKCQTNLEDGCKDRGVPCLWVPHREDNL